jgi:ATP synthase protein I
MPAHREGYFPKQRRLCASFGDVFLCEGARVLADDRQPGPDELDRRIAEAKAAQSRGITDAEGRSESRGWAIGIEFVGTVLVSGLIGWLIDQHAGLGTSPWAMIILLVLGFAAGTRRAIQTSAQFDAEPSNDDKG